MNNEISISFKKASFFYNADVCEDTVKSGLRGTLVIPETLAAQLGLNPNIPIKVKAYAVCDPEDTFDEALGRKIAEAKAESKAYKRAKSILLNAYKVLNPIPLNNYKVKPGFLKKTRTIPTLNPIINDFIEKANGCIEHNERYISEIAK